MESRSPLEDGRKVIPQGDLTVYETRAHQLEIRAVELRNWRCTGFEKLKQKLKAEGCLNVNGNARSPLPATHFGHYVADGAAIRDVLHDCAPQRRARDRAGSRRVQGNGAAEEIAPAIRLLNEWAVRRPSDAGRRRRASFAETGFNLRDSRRWQSRGPLGV